MRIGVSAAAFAAGAVLFAGAALAERDATPFEVRVAVNAYTLDPIAPELQPASLHYATCLKLVNHRGGHSRRSAQLVPEAAGSPRISRNGRVYDFTLREHLSRFSDGRPLHAVDFKRTIERVALSGSYGGELLADVVGARDALQGRARSISGVRARGRQLRITLAAPAGDLLRRLAAPYFCAVPRGTPDAIGRSALPSAGPYYVREWVPNDFAILERNPHYRGPRLRRPDRIRLEWIGGEAAVEAVRAGTIDLYRPHPTSAPPANLRLAVGRLLILQFNTQVGRRLVNRSLRKAIALALDRREIARARGHEFEVPFDRFIPPTVPGASPIAVYSLHRRTVDLERARALATPHLPVTLRLLADGAEPPEYIEQVRTIERNIEDTGIQVELRFCPRCRHVEFDGDIRLWSVERATPASSGDPVEYLRAAFSGPPDVVERVNRLRGRARLDAFRRLEAGLVRDVVPAAALSIANEKYLVSSRIGCVAPHYVYAVDLGALCVRR